MKLASGMTALVAAVSLCLAPALAQTPASWLSLLNAEPGREQKLTAEQVLFHPSTSPLFPGLVAVGYRQSDQTYSLGNLIWDGKVFTPLAGYGRILQASGFAEADDEQRSALFLELLRQCNGPLGIHPYVGGKSRDKARPQPIFGQRQASGGQHSFVVWFCEEPGNREGPEWREVLYQVSSTGDTVRARTLSTFHPVPEGLRDFPSTPSESYE